MTSDGPVQTRFDPTRLAFSADLDRGRTRAELVESNALLRLLLSSVAQAVWETRADGMVVVDSPSWRAYTGQTLDEMLGEGWVRAIHPEDRAYALGLWRDAVRARTNVDAEFRLRHATRGWRWTNVRAAPVFDADGTLCKWVGLNIDIEHRKRAEAEERAAEERQSFLLRLSDRLRSLEDTDELQRCACRLLGVHLRVDRVHYSEVREDDGVVLVGPDYAAPGSTSLSGRHVLAEFGDTPQLHAGRVVVVDDVATDTQLPEVARRSCRALGIAALIAAPYVRDGRLAWTLSVDSRTPRAWTAEEVALVREAGDRTWAEIERTRAQAALAAADRHKDEFLATLAHELRNPLAPIRNGIQIARLAARGDTALQHVLDMMNRQLGHLVRLVDDLLDVARIRAGKITLRRGPVDLLDVVTRSIEAARTLVEQHGHGLEVALPSGPVLVDGDPERLTQVVTNLLSNAVKYTEPGGRLSVRLETHETFAIVQVRDTGIGIPPEALVRVFDLFSQVRPGHEGAEDGLGIGLALVHRLVEMHGGSVVAQSEGAGRGTTMTVRLPLLAAGRATAAPATPAGDSLPAAAARRIVVADDNVDAAESLGVLLQLQGHEVTLVHDGLAAVDAVRRGRPDAVILDLGMPGLDGVEAARRIRALEQGREVLLIALTGWGQERDKQRTREAGFDRHLVKPADPDVVAALLRGHERPH